MKNNKIKSLLKKNTTILTDTLVNELSEDQAYMIEEQVIKSIGRKTLGNGTLTNLSDGGYGNKNCQIKSKWKKTYQFDLQGRLLKEYRSMTEAAEKAGLLLSDISSCCLNRARTHGGFFWSFNKNQKHFIKDKRNRKILQFDLSNNLISIFDSISQASKLTGINCGTISRICSGELLSKDGYWYRYENNLFGLANKKKTCKPVLQIIGSEIKEFSSVKLAAKELNTTTKSIISRCQKKDLYDDLYLIYKEDWEKGQIKTKAKKYNGEKKVIKINDRNQILKTYNSITEAAYAENISRRYLSSNINKKKIKGHLYATICN